MITTKIMGAGGTIGGLAPAASVTVTYDDWSSASDPIDVLSVADVGDLVVLAVSADTSFYSPIFNGMSFTAVKNTFDISNFPSVYVGYRVVQAGDSNPYLGNDSGLVVGRRVSAVAAVIPGASVYVDFSEGSGNSSSLNPGSLTATASYWVFTAHVDDDVGVVFTPPSGYSMLGTATDDPPLSGRSSTGIALKVASLTSETPGDMTYTTTDVAGDDWNAVLLAFT